MLLYGMGAATLAQELQIPPGEARRLIETYFIAFPGVRAWMEQVKHKALSGELFYTPFGRTRHFDVATKENKEEIERQAVNTPVQSLASDIALSALIRLDKRIRSGDLGGTRLLLTVHDSVLLETAEDATEIAKLVKEEMERPVLDDWLAFPADVKIGERWGDLKKLQ